MPPEQPPSTNLGAAVTAIYRYGDRIRKLVAPRNPGNNALVIAKDNDDTEVDNDPLILSILKNPPKNTNPKQLRDGVQFIKDAVAGKPMNDRLMAVCESSSLRAYFS